MKAKVSDIHVELVGLDLVRRRIVGRGRSARCTPRLGRGTRGQRFAIVVDDGTATHVAVEAPGQFEVSKAEALIAAL